MRYTTVDIKALKESDQYKNKRFITKFKPGNTYKMGLVTDSSAEIFFKVVKRTESTVVIVEVDSKNKPREKPVKKGVQIWQDVESCYPYGKYSMAPILRADKVVSGSKWVDEVVEKDESNKNISKEEILTLSITYNTASKYRRREAGYYGLKYDDYVQGLKDKKFLSGNGSITKLGKKVLDQETKKLGLRENSYSNEIAKKLGFKTPF